jgi:diguanylate cyclase (GGDEF)-like protein
MSVCLNLPAGLLNALELCRTLPSVPAVVLQVLDLTQDPNVSASALAKVVARDPALAAKFLRVANSAWCGVRKEITTLDRAINLIGLNAAMSLALSFSLVRGLQKSVGGIFDHRAYWRRSVVSATSTRAVGMHLGATNKDELFLAGLLQDIGMLVLNEALPAYSALVAAANGDHRVLVEAEQNEFGSDHTQAGGWILKKWGLPDRLIASVSTSHAPSGRDDSLASSVVLGGLIADIWANPNSTDQVTKTAAEAARVLCGISLEQFDALLAKTAADLPETTNNLDVAIGDDALVSRLLDHAREALAELNLRALQEVRHFAIQAQQDALTALFNRSYLNQIMHEQFVHSRSIFEPLTIVFLDIDHFKTINDTYGHRCGDLILVSVAQVIQASIRSQDIAVRFGGDEFVILLMNAKEDVAAAISERIRSRIEDKLHKIGEGQTINVTVSVGWATTGNPQISSAAELLEAADRNLYVAKSAGRNRVAQCG